MSLLATEFRKMMSKGKTSQGREATNDILYPTGFLNFDFMNGFIATGLNPTTNEKYKYYNIGICDGSINLMISRSQGGKTTFCTQAASSIVRPFPNGMVFEENVEAGMTIERRMLLSRFSEEEIQNRYIVRNEGITIENFYQRVKAIRDLKMEKYDEFLYDTGHYDIHGNPIKKLVPTVVLLDSLAVISNEKVFDEKDLAGQMTQTAAAKAIAATLRGLLPACKEANIIIFLINHINQKIEANPMVHTQSQTIYLKQGETLPRGNAPIYLSTNILRLDDGRKLKEDEAFGFTGALTKLSTVKSRTAKANQSTTMVFDQERGFDPELSLFIMLKEMGKINGAGVGLYLADRSDMKFSQKTFKDKLATNPEFAEIFNRVCFEALSTIISEPTFTPVDGNNPISMLIQMSNQTRLAA